MSRPTARGIVLFVTSIVVSSSSARAGEPPVSGRDVMSRSTASQAAGSRPVSDGEASRCSHPALRRELLAMVEKDQAVRGRINEEGETTELLEEESRIDWRNSARMKPIVDEFGWPTQSMVAKDGTRAAWLLAMHADHDTKFQRRCLALMKAALKRGEASALHMAYLTDRVRTREGKPQVYGTKNGVIDGVRLYFPIEDLKHVEKRRVEVGLPPLGEYRELPKSLVITMGKPRPAPAQQGGQSEREAMYYRYLEFPSYVKGGSIDPHWMADGSSFWYAEGAPENTIIYKVDPKANTKTPLFDIARLRQAVTPTLGHEPPYKGLPFKAFTFVDESEMAVSFTVENMDLILRLDSYTVTPAPTLSDEETSRLAPQIVRTGYAGSPIKEVLSPDRRWFASVKEHNLWLRSTYDGRSVQLTADGMKDYGWDYGWDYAWARPWLHWSANGFKLAVQKVDYREVEKVPIMHWLKPIPEVEWRRHSFGAVAGGRIPQSQLWIVDILSKRQLRVETGQESDQYLLILRWRSDGSELLFLRMNRACNKLDLMAADPETGATRVILTEAQKTFVMSFNMLWRQGSTLFTLLKDGKRFIWLSERDGWRHLYLYKFDGTLIRRLTEGAFPILSRPTRTTVNEETGWVYFTAHGDPQRPYDNHLYRVNLEGKGFMRLTKATGWRTIQFAPSKEFFLDTHSSVERPSVVELRRADGKLLQTLAKANIDALKELKWQSPEEFVVKASDGKTDLYGVLYKPYDFDPNKKYPVIESIYAGPQSSLGIRQTFTADRGTHRRALALAQLGFVTFFVDGRGTSHRGKEFQDVVYGNFGRHEIPDHVAALRQLAEKRPYMDLSRVGLIGHSWGGYFTIRALLLAPDVYHVGVASAPGVELEGDAGYEPYMGLPATTKMRYEYASNLRLAGHLKGKLLLIYGTSDSWANSQTMKMVDALVRAGKPYDLIVLPELDHGQTRRNTYWQDAVRRYFQEHLKPD